MIRYFLIEVLLNSSIVFEFLKRYLYTTNSKIQSTLTNEYAHFHFIGKFIYDIQLNMLISIF